MAGESNIISEVTSGINGLDSQNGFDQDNNFI
jgi:hypothetical protein